MKRRKMRFLAAFLAALMVMLAMPVYASAAEVRAMEASPEANHILFKNICTDFDVAIGKNRSTAIDRLMDFVSIYQEDPKAELTYEIGGAEYPIAISQSDETYNVDIDLSKSTSNSIFVAVFCSGDYANVTKLSLNNETVSEKDVSNGGAQISKSNYSTTGLTISPVMPAKTYTISLPQSTPDFTVYCEDTNIVEEGKSFSFEIIVNPAQAKANAIPEVTQTIGRNTTSISFSSSQNEDDGRVTYKYTISEIKSDIVVGVVLRQAVSVTWSASNTYDIKGSTSVKYGTEKYEFTVEARPGYEISSVTINGQTLSASEGNKYTYSPEGGITSNFTILVSTIEFRPTVTVEKEGVGTSFTTTAETHDVQYGSSLSFTVEAVNGYQAPKVQVKYTDNSEPAPSLSVSGNNYTITNIIKGITITITGGEEITYSVTTPPKSPAYNLTVTKDGKEQSNFKYGDEVLITLTVNDDYNHSTPIIAINGITTVFSHSENTYTYTYTVRDSFSISVSGLTKNVYNVELPKSDTGYTVSSTSTTVTAGSTYTFTVTLDAGYTWSTETSNVTTTIGNVDSITAGGRTYTVVISGITADTVISFAMKPKITKYSVTPAEKEQKGYVLEIVGGDNVNYGSSVTFTVKAQSGYRVTNVNAVVDNVHSPLTSSGNGRYTISSVTSNVQIEVVVEKIVLTVNYHVSLAPFHGFNFTGFDYTIKYTIDGVLDSSDSSLSVKKLDSDGTNLTATLDNEYNNELPELFLKNGSWNISGYSGSYMTWSFTGASDVTIEASCTCALSNEYEGGNSSTIPFLTLKSEDSGFVEYTENTSYNGKPTYTAAWKAKLTLADGYVDSGLDIEVLAYGSFYSNSKEGLNDRISEFADKIANHTEETNAANGEKIDNTTVLYYTANTDNTFKIGDTFTEKIHFTQTNESQSLERSMQMFFKVRIGDEVFIIFSNVMAETITVPAASSAE